MLRLMKKTVRWYFNTYSNMYSDNYYSYYNSMA